MPKFEVIRVFKKNNFAAFRLEADDGDEAIDKVNYMLEEDNTSDEGIERLDAVPDEEHYRDHWNKFFSVLKKIDKEANKKLRALDSKERGWSRRTLPYLAREVPAKRGD